MILVNYYDILLVIITIKEVILRNTTQRNLILDIINNSCNHLTAEKVHEIARKSISNISLGTVYRNLNFLLDQGSIRKIKINSIDHFDNVKKFHNHFICTKCNTIYDVFEKESITNNTCGKVMSYEIIYKGICNKCIEEEK